MMDSLTESERMEKILKDRELRSVEYFERMQELRNTGVETLEQMLNVNKNLESEIIANVNIPLDLETMTDSEKIGAAFSLIERIRLMFEQQDLNRVIAEKHNMSSSLDITSN